MSLHPQDYYDLMRYYAYGECIECRAATLNLDRGYADFINAVYRYASLFFAAPGTVAAEDVENQKKDMWKFAWENQWLYLQLLKGRAQRSRAAKLDLDDVKSAIVTLRGEAFSTVREGYKKCVEIDRTECSYVRQIEDRGAPASLQLAFDVDIWSEIALRVRHMNEILELLQEADEILNRKKEKPAPAAVAAGMYVFVSHLGRALILQYIRPDSAAEGDKRERLETESNKLLEDSIRHLERALFDAYKEILISVISRVALFRDSGFATEDWWDLLTNARRMEHDRREFPEKIDAYRQLEPGIRGFLDFVKGG